MPIGQSSPQPPLLPSLSAITIRLAVGFCAHASVSFSFFFSSCKKIKNAVVKMENPTDKIIRQLKEENARLMALLSGAGIAAPVGSGDGGDGGDGGGGGGGDVEAMRAKLMEENEAKLKEQMAENEKIINEMKKSWEEKLKD